MTLSLFKDITRSLGPDTPTWGGDPALKATKVSSPEGWRVTELCLSSHVGTHMDFARHFLPEGPDGRDYPTELFVGPCNVLRFDTDTILDAHAVREVVPETQRLLVATYPHTLHITPDGAEELLRKGLRLVGTDTVTVEVGPPFDSHKTLLAAGCVIVEGLLLDGTREGRYLLVCLPMKYDDSDGAPCRALLADVDRLCEMIRS